MDTLAGKTDEGELVKGYRGRRKESTVRVTARKRECKRCWKKINTLVFL
jgi:hypothetical protein